MYETIIVIICCKTIFKFNFTITLAWVELKVNIFFVSMKHHGYAQNVLEPRDVMFRPVSTHNVLQVSQRVTV